ncbi:transposase [Kibdelosporangium phytohabitans]|nr:transposase [Kibdelosporangium phytohabitans]MBE1468903.1 syndecan 1 [Kibdelosporangium phytohabitans]
MDNVVLNEVASALFWSLPRSDQRLKGVQYLRGLLGAHGRKTVRNIATLLGDQATEQSLQHFIGESTWDWVPVRHELARYAVRSAPPQAWVVRSMIIPKSGERCVGVYKDFFPAFGRVLNAQQAVGVWAASDEVGNPVNWRLRLSEAWLADGVRQRALIPDHVQAESSMECAFEALMDTVVRRELPHLPVVLDARDIDGPEAVERFRGTGMPLLARCCRSTQVTVTDRALPGHVGRAMSIHQIMAAAKDIRRPVLLADRGALSSTTLAATVRVRTAYQAKETADLTLMGTGEIGQNWPAQIWLTDMTSAPPSALVRLTRLTDRVDTDFLAVAEQVGIRDYAGRTYTGWHRHVTLASAAHVAITQQRMKTQRWTSYVS